MRRGGTGARVAGKIRAGAIRAGLLAAYLVGSAWAAPGATLALPPDVAPGRVAPLPTSAALLDAAIDRRVQGDTAGAIRHYEAWVAATKDTRLRAAAWVVLGHLYTAQGDHSLAAALYGRARDAATPVAPWATYHRAQADLARGQYAAAASGCDGYRQSWPEGPHAEDCLLLAGDARASAGQRAAAAASYNLWLAENPDSPLRESIQLRLVLASSRANPAGAVPELRALLLSHQYHSTGVTARERLEELVAAGVIPAVLPDDTATLCQIANERRRCGLDEEAQALFQRIVALSADDPALSAWVQANRDDFLRSGRRYEELAARLQDRLEKKPDADLARERYKLLARAGQWSAASDQLIDGIKRYGASFPPEKTTLPRALLLAGRYREAAERWPALNTAEGRWLAAYATFRQERYADALPMLQAIEDADGDFAGAARWYRHRALLGLGRPKEAEALRAKIAEERNSWYGLLARQPAGWGDLSAAAPAHAPPTLVLRDGRWPGSPPPVPNPDEPDPGPLRRSPIPGMVGHAARLADPARVDPALSADPGAVDWSRLTWRRVANIATAGATLPPVELPAPASRRPDSYEPAFFFDPAAGWRLLDGLGDAAPVAFPFAKGAADLARVGAWEDAAPVVSRMYDKMEADRKAGRGSAYAKVTLSVSEWRQIFLLVRDDHHTTKLMWGVSRTAADEQARLAAMRALYPTAHIDAVYREGWERSVDPLLVLGLMRQESVYKQWALSHVGAIGLMQIMPKTGARVAALMGDSHYSPSMLQDPALNIRYGIYYLSRLLDRFGGAFPMAVGSYNGGPHNMSAWLRPWGEKIRMDDYVEQIPYTETRDYIKKVSGYYAVYTSLYAPADAAILIPDRVATDDRSVIDF